MDALELISVSVVTGGHAIDESSFKDALSSLIGIVCQIQPLETFAAQSSQARQKFDVVLFYNYHQDIGGEAQSKAALVTLGETEQGLVVLHHALVAFPRWSVWDDLCGIQGRQFKAHKQQMLQVEIAQPDHPIMHGLQAWEMIDETYLMESARNGSEILLKTTHPLSLNTIAWTRHYKNAQVFCYQSGHGQSAYTNLNFCEVLKRGIQWAARRI